MSDAEKRRGYDLPLTMQKWRFWTCLAMIPLAVLFVECKCAESGLGPGGTWIVRCLYLLLLLMAGMEFVTCFGMLHFVPEGIAITICGKTLRQFPRENIRFMGIIVYMKKGTAYKWICVCAKSMEELAVEQERKTPKMLRNGRTRPGWAEDMAGKCLLRYADSLHRRMGFPRKDILLIEWSPERLERLLSMYPGIPCVDLMAKKIRDAERKEPVPKRLWSRHIW